MKTIKDIAKVAAVSPSTVSRVLNNSGGYSEKTKQRILTISKQLNYQKNEYASSLVSTQKVNVIGVIVTNAKSSFSTKIIEGVEDFGYQKDARILLAHCGMSDNERLRKCIDLMLRQNVTGIISISVQFDEDNLAYLNKFDMPLISINVVVPGYPSITINNYQAAYQATQFIIEHGHRQIALVGVKKDDLQTGYNRIDGYSKALMDHKITIDQNLIIDGDFSFDSGRKSFETLLKLPKMPTAVFAASDDTAAGIISGAYEHDYNIAGELSIMGFDNSKISEMITPQLTTVVQPFYEMGELAVKEILDSKPEASVVLPVNIIDRGSVFKTISKYTSNN
ncbi:HTH-type transcriptional repressor PurR2 [Paucilactobacillus oligofermentans DSM 15707 = LMG 22743]|nr:substrate-binding domain-containing protein [Paucilactobacillus oligofermentans]CUS27051.1 HTH-type transcriptional repressor PurR2 [Paucilactobacillus oligofermentans DSM 15707 = LMG 22743]